MMRSLIVTAVIIAVFAACPAGQKKKDAKIAENDIKTIQELYRPASCFQTSMMIEFSSPNGKKEKGKAALHADYEKNRMYLVIKDPLFGIEVVRVLKSGEMIHVWNIQTRKTEKFPVAQFELSGIGNNSVQIPFSLFQNFIYGTLPDDLFRYKSKIKKEEKKLFVNQSLAGADYEYEFYDNHLQKLVYLNRSDKTRADVELGGLFGDTVFPRTIDIEAGRMDAAAGKEKISILLSDVNLKAKCDDRYFQMR